MSSLAPRPPHSPTPNRPRAVVRGGRARRSSQIALDDPEKRVGRLFDPDYLTAQAARHVEWLRRLGIYGDHGVACLLRVPGWPTDGAAGGHLRQTCPCCGLMEARGDYCSRCRCRTGPQDWHDRGTTDAQQAGITKARAAKRAQAAPATEKSGLGREQRSSVVTRSRACGRTASGADRPVLHKPSSPTGAT